MNVSAEELRSFFESRFAMYGFLASVFKTEPSNEFLERLSSSSLPIELHNQKFAQGCRCLVKALRTQSALTRSRLVIDYSKLFLGAGAPEGLLPYESIQRGGNVTFMQAPRDEVVLCYKKAGFCVAPHYDVPEDHIHLEFEFMALCAQQAERALSQNEIQKAQAAQMRMGSFLNEHLLKWVPAWCQRAYQEASTEYYRGILLLTEGFLDDEAELHSFVEQALAEMLGETHKAGCPS